MVTDSRCTTRAFNTHLKLLSPPEADVPGTVLTLGRTLEYVHRPIFCEVDFGPFGQPGVADLALGAMACFTLLHPSPLPV